MGYPNGRYQFELKWSTTTVGNPTMLDLISRVIIIEQRYRRNKTLDIFSVKGIPVRVSAT